MTHIGMITLYRSQFSFVVVLTIAISKSQRQFFNHVGVYLETHMLITGQLYVALSRRKHSNKMRVVT